MARSYYGTRISENMVRTPEGYLICRNVPIARTGWQKYRGSEIGLDADGMVDVYRSEDEVFCPATLASFEGKTVTDNHPSEWIQPSNENAYHKGHSQNIRRGAGAENDLLLADLFIKDAVLINKIENGLREVSCGYDCIYEPISEGRYAQKDIRGNHVAVVSNGRAGDRVAIRDSRAREDFDTKRRNPMRKIDWRYILGLGLKEFAKDEDPEAVANAFEAAKEGEARLEKRNADDFPPKPGEEKPPAAPPAAPAAEGGVTQMQMLERILAVLEQLVQSDKEVHAQLPKPKEPEDALDELEIELKGEKGEEGQEEEEFTGDTGVVEPVETLPPDDLPQNPIPGADSKALIAAIRAVKPIIANIPDRAERQKAADSVISAFREMMGPGKTKDGYAAIARRDVKPPTTDSSGKKDESAYGREIKEKYHRKAVVNR